ncbi:Aldehyde dehydrogenase (Acceptor) [Bosea sp. LC85]|uniref:aldehyde dehydrogenase family protein n=1 Tax=Bosea sp. LC85 TaxID=1502851 RepID=UPI0004E3E2B5|nr:aldehyde dehydrogenase family protein [Bosea sp. LC85]KFC69342.1 Aldehyde dehydrogenase (Acceptor) [Bosea sp. LC85]
MSFENAADYRAIAGTLALPAGAFIDGRLAGTADGKLLDSVNPATDELAVANDSDYGLHATLYTRDLDRALFMSRRLACGTVAINGFTEGDLKTPFGGYKRSGSLARDKGLEAMGQYLQTKTTWISISAPARQG